MACGSISMSGTACSDAICTIISIRCLVSPGDNGYENPNIGRI